MMTMKPGSFILSVSISVALLSGATGCGNDLPDRNSGAEEYAEGNTMVIYEANPRVFASSESLNAIESRLVEIEKLGVNVIWLMPVYEQGVKNSVGSPYCIRDYKKVNPSFGTLDDLKSLVTKAHSMGMKVILDWVANHTSWDNAWIEEHPEWYTRDSDGNIIPPAGMGWNDVADLDYDNAGLRAGMIDAMTWWIREAGVDGFRCDYAEGVPADFWKEAIKAVRTLDPDAVMLAEASDTKLLDCGFQMLYGWDFQSKLASLFGGRTSVQALYESHANEYKGLPDGKERLRFTTNHDKAGESSPVAVYKAERGAMAAFVISAYSGGVPLIYSSQEIGYAGKVNFFTDVIMDWDSNPSYIEEYVGVMAAYIGSADVRGSKPVFYNTGGIVSIYYEGGLFVVVNTSGSEVSAKSPMERAGDKVTDMITGLEETVPSVLVLDAYEYKIWKRNQL